MDYFTQTSKTGPRCHSQIYRFTDTNQYEVGLSQYILELRIWLEYWGQVGNVLKTLPKINRQLLEQYVTCNKRPHLEMPIAIVHANICNVSQVFLYKIVMLFFFFFFFPSFLFSFFLLSLYILMLGNTRNQNISGQALCGEETCRHSFKTFLLQHLVQSSMLLETTGT